MENIQYIFIIGRLRTGEQSNIFSNFFYRWNYKVWPSQMSDLPKLAFFFPWLFCYFVICYKNVNSAFVLPTLHFAVWKKWIRTWWVTFTWWKLAEACVLSCDEWDPGGGADLILVSWSMFSFFVFRAGELRLEPSTACLLPLTGACSL